MREPLTSHLGHGIIQLHILLCNLPAILYRFRLLPESIGFDLAYHPQYHAREGGHTIIN